MRQNEAGAEEAIALKCSVYGLQRIFKHKGKCTFNSAVLRSGNNQAAAAHCLFLIKDSWVLQ